MTPPPRIKRSNTEAVEGEGERDGESHTKRKRLRASAAPVEPSQSVEPAPKTAVKAKAKKKPSGAQPETPELPKIEAATPDHETSKAVESSLKRMPTVDVVPANKPNDSNKKNGKGEDKTNEKPVDSSGSSDDEETLAKKAEEVRTKREAHARFMRFSRSLTRS